MNEVQDLVGRVQAARTDPEAADALIRQYMGFIRAETAKFIKRAPIDGQDEELSIAMLAFYEAILGYEQNRGAFLSYASRGIRNRMIDHYRKEKKYRLCGSRRNDYGRPAQTGGRGAWLL